MTTPDIEWPIYSYTFKGGATASDSSVVTSGNSPRGSNSIPLPVGENTIRVTALANPTANARLAVAHNGRSMFLNDWKAVGATGIIVQAPNDDPDAWLALRSDTPDVVYGVTIINSPPTR